jgi:hypothetical protein
MAPGTPAAEAQQHEVILRTNDEGGALTLTARRTTAGWTGFTLLDEERRPAEQLVDDPPDAPGTLTRTLGPADTWLGALGLLDSLVWETLHPEYVHAEFRQMVISAVRERAADADNACAEFVDDWLPEWERVCSAN